MNMLQGMMRNMDKKFEESNKNMDKKLEKNKEEVKQYIDRINKQ